MSWFPAIASCRSMVLPRRANTVELRTAFNDHNRRKASGSRDVRRRAISKDTTANEYASSLRAARVSTATVVKQPLLLLTLPQVLTGFQRKSASQRLCKPASTANRNLREGSLNSNQPFISNLTPTHLMWLCISRPLRLHNSSTASAPVLAVTRFLRNAMPNGSKWQPTGLQPRRESEPPGQGPIPRTR